jgi:hypothetical protein
MSSRVVKRGSGPSELPAVQFHHQPVHHPYGKQQNVIYFLSFVCIVLLMTVFGLLTRSLERTRDLNGLGSGQLADVSNLSPPDQTGNIFVSYSYFEKDDVQVRSCPELLFVLTMDTAPLSVTSRQYLTLSEKRSESCLLPACYCHEACSYCGVKGSARLIHCIAWFACECLLPQFRTFNTKHAQNPSFMHIFCSEHRVLKASVRSIHVPHSSVLGRFPS